MANIVMGRVEGEGSKRHGHVTAIAVAAPYRRMGIAKSLMAYFEAECEADGTCYYIDLFVRPMNQKAVGMYEKFGFVVYRRILGYYKGKDPEDAFDMRKAVPREGVRTQVIPLKDPVHFDDVSD